MSYTNFALLTDEQKTAWSLEFWKHARNLSFVTRFLGTGFDSLIQRVTELKRSEKGARAVLTLMGEIEGDGIAGDRQLEGNEGIMPLSEVVIRMDQIRHATRSEGRMSEQKSVVDFRRQARDQLAYWIADIVDQMAFLTMAGIDYSMKTNGAPRTGSDLPNLEFAQDVTPPSPKRVARWNKAGLTLETGGASNTVVAGDTPSWETFVQLKAYAKESHMRGIMESGEEVYHAFLSPTAMGRLKLDPTYMQNLRHATSSGANAKLFTGGAVKVDGIYLHEFRHVPNTTGAAAGSKYGDGGNVEGCQMLFCGAQALAMADIGPARWVEKYFDFDNACGISVGKILGFLKPSFTNQYLNNTKEDFGVISVYCAQ
jgi:N4-gp56 family major capsid protein